MHYKINILVDGSSSTVWLANSKYVVSDRIITLHKIEFNLDAVEER